MLNLDPMEERLHRYVDNAMSAAERRDFEEHLAQHPELAARARDFLAQNTALHRAFDPVLNEPHGLSVRAPRAANAPRWRLPAALAASLCVGLIGGYLLRPTLEGGSQRGTQQLFAQQAALAYVAYVPEVRHPVEVSANEQAHLLGWLSKRLEGPLKAPSLQSAGYQLLGGRLLPAPADAKSAPVALLMYENPQGKRLSLLVRRAADNKDTAFRFMQDGGTRVFYWIDGPFGYALAGDVEREELSRLAQAVYRELNP